MIRLLAILSTLILSGCFNFNPQNIFKFEGQTMGTYYRVTVIGELDEEKVNKLKNEVESYLLQFDKELSTYRSDSTISEFNGYPANKDFKSPKLLRELIQESKELYKFTNKHFDPTISPLVKLWGFGGSGKIVEEPTSTEIEKRLKLVGMDKIAISMTGKVRKKVENVEIDLNGIAPGRAVDDISAILRQRGYPNHLVDIGGEVKGSGKKLDNSWWHIGVETPLENAELGSGVSKVFPLKFKALATSGNYRNFYKIKGKKYGHTLSPVTGTPVNNDLASVTVIDEKCSAADALATALMVMGPDKGFEFAKKKKLKAFFIVFKDGNFVTSLSPALELYLKEGL